MVYDTKELIDKSKKILNNKKSLIHYVEDLSDELGISKQTFYSHGLNEIDAIKDGLSKNKRLIKKGLRKKWYDSKSSACQISLYKLLGTLEERQALTQTNIDHTSKGNEIEQAIVNIHSEPNENNKNNK